MITGLQIRLARTALRWSVKDLADRSGVSVPTIKRFEVSDGIPPSRSSTLHEVRTTLEAAGVEFIGTPDDRPGVRLSVTSKDAR